MSLTQSFFLILFLRSNSLFLPAYRRETENQQMDRHTDRQATGGMYGSQIMFTYGSDQVSIRGKPGMCVVKATAATFTAMITGSRLNAGINQRAGPLIQYGGSEKAPGIRSFRQRESVALLTASPPPVPLGHRCVKGVCGGGIKNDDNDGCLKDLQMMTVV